MRQRDVAANIQPETVHIKSLGAANGISVLEQNYRYDLLTPQTLLEKYVGKRVRAYRYHEQTGKEDVVDADLLSVADSPVLKINGEITFGYPGRLAFPQVPDNLVAKSTLMWLVDSKAVKQSVEVTYLTQNLNWSADYVLVVNDSDTTGDLIGWVTLVNQSGASYKNAQLKLVAGDVNRVQPQVNDLAMIGMAKAARSQAQFQEQGLFEYHLYTLERPTTVLQNEQKQVNTLRSGARRSLAETRTSRAGLLASLREKRRDERERAHTWAYIVVGSGCPRGNECRMPHSSRGEP